MTPVTAAPTLRPARYGSHRSATSGFEQNGDFVDRAVIKRAKVRAILFSPWPQQLQIPALKVFRRTQSSRTFVVGDVSLDFLSFMVPLAFFENELWSSCNQAPSYRSAYSHPFNTLALINQ
jgi:hypothetical protein